MVPWKRMIGLEVLLLTNTLVILESTMYMVGTDSPSMPRGWGDDSSVATVTSRPYTSNRDKGQRHLDECGDQQEMVLTEQRSPRTALKDSRVNFRLPGFPSLPGVPGKPGILY